MLHMATSNEWHGHGWVNKWHKIGCNSFILLLKQSTNQQKQCLLSWQSWCLMHIIRLYSLQPQNSLFSLLVNVKWKCLLQYFPSCKFAFLFLRVCLKPYKRKLQFYIISKTVLQQPSKYTQCGGKYTILRYCLVFHA